MMILVMFNHAPTLWQQLFHERESITGHVWRAPRRLFAVHVDLFQVKRDPSTTGQRLAVEVIYFQKNAS
jgi:hypothetical protein